jgi:hypothetical protein
MKYATYKASTVIISRFVDNDLGHDGEASNHKKDEFSNRLSMHSDFMVKFTKSQSGLNKSLRILRRAKEYCIMAVLWSAA